MTTANLSNIYARPSRLSKPLLAGLALAHVLILGITEQTLDLLWSKAHAAHAAQSLVVVRAEPITVTALGVR
jgi:hypothetical protein